MLLSYSLAYSNGNTLLSFGSMSTFTFFSEFVVLGEYVIFVGIGVMHVCLFQASAASDVLPEQVEVVQWLSSV